MNVDDIKVCVLRVGGTNCDAETQRAFQELGVQAETVHVNELIKRRNLLDYSVLVFPGGFSFGDYVRAGVIFARHLSAKLGKEIDAFVDEGRPILGICNGFQILVENGLLPGISGVSAYPEATLTTNEPQGFKCQWVYLKQENRGKCAFTNRIPAGKVIRLPIAHGEGRLLFPKEKEQAVLKKLVDEDMLVFRYCTKEGKAADSKYPPTPTAAFRHRWHLQPRRQHLRLDATSREGNVLVATTRLDTADADAAVRRRKTHIPKHHRQTNQTR